jgi:phage FluMu protein Com
MTGEQQLLAFATAKGLVLTDIRYRVLNDQLVSAETTAYTYIKGCRCKLKFREFHFTSSDLCTYFKGKCISFIDFYDLKFLINKFDETTVYLEILKVMFP